MRNMSDPFIFFTNLLNITQSEKIDILQNIPRQKLHIFPGNHLFQTHFYDFEYLENNTARKKYKCTNRKNQFYICALIPSIADDIYNNPNKSY